MLGTPIHDSGNVYHFKRNFNQYSINEFKLQLNYELWDDVFSNDGATISFNNFLNTYLRLFYACFPIRKVNQTRYTKAWITPEIRNLCLNKRKLHIRSRNSSDPCIKENYEKYCKKLSEVITTAKQYYDNPLIKSQNKQKTTWNIIKNLTNNSNKNNINNNLDSMKIQDKSFNNPVTIANNFNKYFY
jgi:hypothetical protein